MGLWVATLVLCTSIAPASAWATPVFELVFVSTTGQGTPGATSISAAPGDLLVAELRLTAGPEGVSSYAISLEFDADLRDELDVVSFEELLPIGFSSALTPDELALVLDSTPDRAGLLYTFEAATLGVGPVSRTFSIGSIEFRVGAGVLVDGPDLRLGFFNTGVDGIFDNEGRDLGAAAVLETATVNAVPEPHGLLLVAGIWVHLAERSRRRGESLRGP